MRVPALLAAVASAMIAASGALPARAQTAGSGAGAIDRFEPTPAGDALFTVPSAYVGGHLVPRANAYFDFAYRPLSLETAGGDVAIVSSQGILHVGASFSIFERLLISASMPFALTQGGESPTLGGYTFQSPAGAAVGDLRLGARIGIFGKYWDPLQVSLGANVFVPTGDAASYVGEGSIRGAPELLLGGRFEKFLWNLALGTMLRSSDRPHEFTLGAGAAFTPWGDVVQFGPEFWLALPFSDDDTLRAGSTVVKPDQRAAAEVLLGIKARPFIKSRIGSAFVLGASGGPGLTHAIGTPVFRTVGMLAYDPLPPRPSATDSDGDGVPDSIDTCPRTPGGRSEDPLRNGCPQERGIGGDRDHDGIADADDACPYAAGEKSDDETRSGCPADKDGDGIPDAQDACPQVRGVLTADAKTNGCVVDMDGDGIADAQDACPNERGASDPDPEVSGCPKSVRVTDKEIVLLKQVKFRTGSSRLDNGIDPISEDLLTEVRDAIQQHPEIEEIEVQGHADVTGPAMYNVELSQERADAVRKWLIAHGVSPRKLVARGYGASVPAAENETKDGRQKNRRVQLVVLSRRRR